jgi:CRISPR-associated protein Csx17
MLGQNDDQRLEDLLWGLMLIDPKGEEVSMSNEENEALLPSTYAILKLTVLPWQLNWGFYKDRVILRTARRDESRITIKPERTIFYRLRAADIQGACEIAARRLRAAGLVPLATHRPDGSRRDITWSAGNTSAERLLAALLFPISESKMNAIAELVLQPPKFDSLA